MRRTVAVDGQDGVDEVRERYAVLSRWSSWAAPIRGVESSNGRLVAGMTGVVHGAPGVRVNFVVDTGGTRWLTPGTGRCGWASCDWRSSTRSSRRAAVGRRRRFLMDGLAAPVLLYPPIAKMALRRLVGR